MKLCKTLAILLIILFFHSLLVTGQNFDKGCTKCEALKLFLNAPTVDSNFSHYNLGIIDTFFIVDMDCSLTECKISTWRGKPVKLLVNGSLYDSVMKYCWPGLEVNKKKLFKFSMNKYNELFIQGYGSLFSETHYKIKKGKYFLGLINDSVE